MHDWLKQNQKKLMAIMGALLMVTFLINTPLGSMSSGERSRGRPVGKAGKFVLYSEDVHQKEQEWRTLSQCIRIDIYKTQGQLVYATDSLGSALSRQMKDHPEVFPLLVREAEDRGINFNDDVINAVLQNQLRPAPWLARPDDALLRQSARDFLMVQALRELLTSDAKYVEPQWQHDLADTQLVSLNLVELDAEKQKNLVAPPTPQQVQALYDQYKNVQVDSPIKPPDDILGFGYELPNQVKLQYVTVPRDKVLDAVKAVHLDHAKGDFDYDLREKAFEYYHRNESEFTRAAPATQPTTNPTTVPTTLATTLPTTLSATTQAITAVTQPTTKPALALATVRPFAEVKVEIIDKLLQPEADKLQEDILASIRAQLSAEWVIRPKDVTTQPSSQPTTAPTTDPSPAANPAFGPQLMTDESYARLEKIAADIQGRFNVRPELTQIAEWQTAKTLPTLPGIGSTKSGTPSLAEMAIRDAAPFITDPARKAISLQPWQPSDVLRDAHQNAYVFRLTATSPAHAPPLAEVAARVESDARLKAAYDAATDAAKKLLEAAKRDGFYRAALDDHRAVTSTGLFDVMGVFKGQAIPNFFADSATARTLAEKAQDLLSSATPAAPHPTVLIPVPAERRILVAELADVAARMPESAQFQQKMHNAQEEELGMSEALAAGYFDLAKVTSRMGYQPDQSVKE